jgi:hypothetical protein
MTRRRPGRNDCRFVQNSGFRYQAKRCWSIPAFSRLAHDALHVAGVAEPQIYVLKWSVEGTIGDRLADQVGDRLLAAALRPNPVLDNAV